MKLYVPFKTYDYEGGYIFGVFSSKEKAQAALDKEEFLGDANGVLEFTIDKEKTVSF